MVKSMNSEPERMKGIMRGYEKYDKNICGYACAVRVPCGLWKKRRYPYK